MEFCVVCRIRIVDFVFIVRSFALLWVEGRGRRFVEILGCWGYLDFCICVFVKEDRVGRGYVLGGF